MSCIGRWTLFSKKIPKNQSVEETLSGSVAACEKTLNPVDKRLLGFRAQTLSKTVWFGFSIWADLRFRNHGPPFSAWAGIVSSTASPSRLTRDENISNETNSDALPNYSCLNSKETLILNPKPPNPPRPAEARPGSSLPRSV